MRGVAWSGVGEVRVGPGWGQGGVGVMAGVVPSQSFCQGRAFQGATFSPFGLWLLALERGAVAERDQLSRMGAHQVPGPAVCDECVEVRMPPPENIELGVTL